jgi:hypothetical protein
MYQALFPPPESEPGFEANDTSTLFFVYISLSYAFKLTIHIVGLILAFLTRKVNSRLIL